VSDRQAIAWLHRRIAFGLAPGELDRLEAAGIDAALDELFEPDAHGVPAAPDPWLVSEVPGSMPELKNQLALRYVNDWLVAMAASPRPFLEWMRWFWHGHFVSTLPVVSRGHPVIMANQLRTFHELGLGDFRTLLRAVTIDPAMLLYLNGAQSKKGAVNENFGREVLELFTLGIGNYTEQDVRAGAVALTGWHTDRDVPDAGSTFVAKSHDDTPQDYLGRTGVHDVDSVIDTIVAQPSLPGFITHKLSRAILGDGVDQAQLDTWAKGFADSGLQIKPLVRTIVEAGLSHPPPPMPVAPVPWCAAMVRATGVPLPSASARPAMSALSSAGQLPMYAPNVGGWPGGRAWLSSATTVGRYDLANVVAASAPAGSAVMQAAVHGPNAALADALGYPEGFGAATYAALDTMRGKDATGTSVLALAMAAPETALV
jgi:uncharacterized protein (DUF1800 family)